MSSGQVRYSRFLQVPDRIPDWEVEALTTLLYLEKVVLRACCATQSDTSGPTHKLEVGEHGRVFRWSRMF